MKANLKKNVILIVVAAVLTVAVIISAGVFWIPRIIARREDAPTVTAQESTTAKPEPIFKHTVHEQEAGTPELIEKRGKSLSYGVFYPVTGDEAVDAPVKATAQTIAEEFEKTPADPSGQSTVLRADYRTSVLENAESGCRYMSVIFDIASGLDENEPETQSYRIMVFDLNGDTKLLALDDVFGGDYLNVLAKKTGKYFAGTSLADYTGTELFKTNTGANAENYKNFALQDGKIVFFFDSGRLAPEKEGCQKAELIPSELYYQLKIKLTEREPFRFFSADEKLVALTFDDGPSKGRTERILKILADNGGRATFFTLGMMVNKSPESVKKAYLSGCDIGNHSFNHRQMNPSMSDAAISKEINTCNDAVIAAAGAPPSFFRFPYGFKNERAANMVGMPIIAWSIDTVDWSVSDTRKKNRSPQEREADIQTTLNRVLNHVQDGDIVLMHDVHSITVDVCERLIPELTARGYRLVTLHELFAAKGITPENGKIYRRVVAEQ